ncbi:hypothetical protein ACQV2E_10535 [Pantoea allii]|uniref:hypothetical protein n=1 Tax=Pantoea allii TaxID=574096 RepID=UPI003D3201B0
MKKEEILLPSHVSTDEFPLLRTLSNLKSGIYTVVMPDGANGSLMKLSSGNLTGLTTTSIVSGGKITGTAGMEEIEISNEVARLLLKLTNYTVLSERINILSNNFKQLLNYQLNEFKSSVDNMFLTLKDLSRKMPAILEDDNYSQLVSNTIPLLKRDAGQFFEFQKGAFIHQHLNNQRRHNDIYSYISILDDYKLHPVFYAYDILIMLEIYEIMIAGKNNKNYVAAVRESLNERIQPILNFVNAKHNDIKKAIDDFVYTRENTSMILLEHQKASKKEQEMHYLLFNKYNFFISLQKKSNEYIDDELSITELKEAYFKIEDSKDM